MKPHFGQRYLKLVNNTYLLKMSFNVLFCFYIEIAYTPGYDFLSDKFTIVIYYKDDKRRYENCYAAQPEYV